MKTISVDAVIDIVTGMCIEANLDLPDDVVGRLEKMESTEVSPLGKTILSDILKNSRIAREKRVPICQDTGMAVFFVEVGQDLMIEGGTLTNAINEGVRRGYKAGYLRNSVVNDPLRRVNTKDNTPAVIHYDLVAGDQLKLTLAPKGFGSENMSRSKMLKPSDGVEGVVDFVLESVSIAGPNPCPPIVVGVGIGGTFEVAAKIAKKSLTRPIGERHSDSYYAELEERLLEEVNRLGIGPQGLGGRTTALDVHIEVFPTHIAGLPVVVNLNCHASRHVERIL